MSADDQIRQAVGWAEQDREPDVETLSNLYKAADAAMKRVSEYSPEERAELQERTEQVRLVRQKAAFGQPSKAEAKPVPPTQEEFQAKVEEERAKGWAALHAYSKKLDNSKGAKCAALSCDDDADVPHGPGRPRRVAGNSAEAKNLRLREAIVRAAQDLECAAAVLRDALKK